MLSQISYFVAAFCVLGKKRGPTNSEDREQWPLPRGNASLPCKTSPTHADTCSSTGAGAAQQKPAGERMGNSALRRLCLTAQPRGEEQAIVLLYHSSSSSRAR